ncbi:MAG: START-like domain-containing protein [Bacteroidota bacterium]
MGKFKYVAEYEIKAAVKMLYPYISTASGLQEWFADEVNIAGDKLLNFIWDGESHVTKIVSRRTNSAIKFLFLPENGSKPDHEDDNDLHYLEFKIDFNEMTQTSFLRVTDYSEMDDLEELHELWDQLINNLKEILGSS